jgi:hypothetical protein
MIPKLITATVGPKKSFRRARRRLRSGDEDNGRHVRTDLSERERGDLFLDHTVR